MIEIEVRDKDGNLLASAGDFNGVVTQLVAAIEEHRETIASQHRAAEDVRAMAEPDLSATAPEHHMAFAAGWRTCHRAIAGTLSGIVPVEEEHDAAVARIRLDEIAADPRKLVRGEDLMQRLAVWEAE